MGNIKVSLKIRTTKGVNKQRCLLSCEWEIFPPNWSFGCYGPIFQQHLSMLNKLWARQVRSRRCLCASNCKFRDWMRSSACLSDCLSCVVRPLEMQGRRNRGMRRGEEPNEIFSAATHYSTHWLRWHRFQWCLFLTVKLSCDLSYDRIKRYSKQHVTYSDTVSLYPICSIHIRNGMEARA